MFYTRQLRLPVDVFIPPHTGRMARTLLWLRQWSTLSRKLNQTATIPEHALFHAFNRKISGTGEACRRELGGHRVHPPACGDTGGMARKCCPTGEEAVVSPVQADRSGGECGHCSYLPKVVHPPGPRKCCSLPQQDSFLSRPPNIWN